MSSRMHLPDNQVDKEGARVDLEPRLMKAPNGWLAVSPDGFTPRIAVVGRSEDEAKEAFGQELKAWQELRARPDPAPMRKAATA
jgi:hypothetical protein